MADPFDFYRSEIKNPTPPERRADRLTDPKLIGGYWRIEAAKTKPDYPVCIWTRDGEQHTVFQIGRKVMNTAQNPNEWQDFVSATWLHCHAVTKADWAAALETGFWPSDKKPATKLSQDDKLGISTESTGANEPPLPELLADQISTLAERAKNTPEPTTQAEADAATGLLDRLRALLKKAESERVIEKAPFWEAGKAVDAKWQAISAPGKTEGEALDKRRKAFLLKEQKKRDEAARIETKRLQDEAEAENKRIREENAARTAAANEAGVPQEPVELLPEVVAPVVEAKRASAGTAYGRQSGLKLVKVAVIDDLPKLVNSLVFAGSGPDPDALAYFQGRADKALRGGVLLPGVISKEELK